jgi:hypothetical protein
MELDRLVKGRVPEKEEDVAAMTKRLLMKKR